jgi:diguanylate cyclase (GGDEF)-like protein
MQGSTPSTRWGSCQGRATLDDRPGEANHTVTDEQSPGNDSARESHPTRAHRYAMADARRASSADQAVADADQSASDADQGSSDADQTAADSDQSGADMDQRASDMDQATADRDRAALADLTSADESAYRISRGERAWASSGRLGSRLGRGGTGRDRDAAATSRDRMAEIRDEGGRGRDAHAADLAQPTTERETELFRQLEELRAQAAADRARAADDRARAAGDRAKWGRERGRLESEISAAHLDGLTGAYGREMGHLALSHEIDRARRSDGRFVIAFVDVDRLKDVNDRDGHAAGDRVLQSVVRAMRTRLRSFDPIIRHGGDEFVCGLGDTDIAEVARRFDSIGIAIQEDVRVGISVGLAELAPGDTADALTERADAAMLEVKATHQARWT